MSDTILAAGAFGVGEITRNRPAVRNAPNTAMRAALTAALAALGGRARVVVLTGAGPGFCAGQDLADRAPGTATDLEASLSRIRADAADWGMIWEAVPDDAFAARWQSVAARSAAGPPAANARRKAALRATWANGFETQMALEVQLQGECGRMADFAEGVAAFREKRPARFTGV